MNVAANDTAEIKVTSAAIPVDVLERARVEAFHARITVSEVIRRGTRSQVEAMEAERLAKQRS